MVTPWAFSMVELYDDFKAQRYPFPGGILNQPALYRAAMLEIEAELTTIAKLEADRLKR